MPLSTDITVPKTVTPIFPDRCVACGMPDPGATLHVSTNAIGWWTIAHWGFGRRFSVDVPACEECRRWMIRQRWVRRSICGIFLIIGFGVAIYALGSFHGAIKRWLAMGIVLACTIPWFVWEAFFPRPIDLTAYADSVQYEFRDEDYADEFLELNQDAAEVDT